MTDLWVEDDQGTEPDELSEDFSIVDENGVVEDIPLTPLQRKLMAFLEALPDDEMLTLRSLVAKSGISQSTIYDMPTFIKQRHSCRHKSSPKYLWGNERRVAWYKERYPA